ncbi:MAG: putative bifunctional diguanylate cyclase/phosphodiesterase [Thermoanaerobaculia bacterium]
MASETEKQRVTRRKADREFVEATAVPMLVIGSDWTVLSSNRPALNLLGSPLDGTFLAARFLEQDAAEQLATVRHSADGASERRLTLTASHPGQPARVELALGTAREDGSIIVSAREIPPATDSADQRSLASRYRQLFEHNLAGIYRCDLEGRILDCNDSFAQMLGYPTQRALLDSGDPSPYLEAHEREWLFRELQQERTKSRVEICMRKADGTPAWALQNLALIDDGERVFVEGTMFDITARRLAEEQIAYQSNYDALTGLPNPTLLRERLEVALSHSERATRHVCVAFLDLDHFKAINDTLSHRVGDQLLQLVAYRIQNCLREYDTVARLGGDEFTVILQHVKSREDAAHIAGKLLASITEPFLLEGREFFMTASMGLALSGSDGNDAETLLRNADVAMYRAKDSGRNTYEFFGQSSGDHAAERFELENDLRRALQRDEFRLHFQPQIDSANGRVLCMEALIRWAHPTRGLVPPNTFIPIAEEVGLIIPIGEWVLEEACREAASWRKDRGWNLRVAVNLSPRQFHQKDLPQLIARVLEKTGLPAEYLEIEITESNAMRNPEMAIKMLTDLKAMGLRISIDDFGTGYSSLSYLRRFPIDSLKIDQSFVRDIETNENDAAIVSAVIAMAHKLRLTVVAEGVETESQSEFLRSQQCEQMQGFLFSVPKPVADLHELMSRQDEKLN